MFFPVALLSPATVSEETPAMVVNRPVRLKVPRLASLLRMSTILLGVLGTIPPTILPTPPNLPTRPIPPRRCLVALTSIMLVLPVPVSRRALKVMSVGLEFTRRPIIGIFICLF